MKAHLRKWGAAYLLLALFLASWLGQFFAQLAELRQEAAVNGTAFDWSEFFPKFWSATFENWQSEFLQLLWQVVGLAYFLYIGSPASKENDDRLEAKVDALLRMNGGEDAEKLIADLDAHYLRKDGHAQPHGHEAELARTAGRGLGPAARAAATRQA